MAGLIKKQAVFQE